MKSNFCSLYTSSSGFKLWALGLMGKLRPLCTFGHSPKLTERSQCHPLPCKPEAVWSPSRPPLLPAPQITSTVKLWGLITPHTDTPAGLVAFRLVLGGQLWAPAAGRFVLLLVGPWVVLGYLGCLGSYLLQTWRPAELPGPSMETAPRAFAWRCDKITSIVRCVPSTNINQHLWTVSFVDKLKQIQAYFCNTYLQVFEGIFEYSNIHHQGALNHWKSNLTSWLKLHKTLSTFLAIWDVRYVIRAKARNPIHRTLQSSKPSTFLAYVETSS